MLRFLIALLTMLLFVSFVPIQAPAQTQEVTVVYNDGVAPFKFEDAAGQAAGILPDIWRHWSRQTGRPIRFIRAETFTESLDMVREGKADLNAGLFHTAEREAFLEFTEPVFTLDYYIFTHPALKATASLEDLQGLVMGVPQGGFTRDLVSRVVPDALIREYRSNEELFYAALRGEIKVFVSTEVSLLYFLDQKRQANTFGYVKNVPLSSQEYRAAARKDRTDLIATVDAGLAGITAAEYTSLVQRWLTSGTRIIPPEFTPLLTAEELEYLAHRSRITVHNEGDWAPFNFNENGEPRGYSIDYIRLLAEKAGLDVAFRTGPSWDQFQEMLREGTLDVMMNIAVTPARSEYMAFTPPYVNMAQMLYTRRGLPRIESLQDLFGKRFAVPRGFYFHEVLAQYPEIEIVSVRDITDAVLAVSSGKADALVDLMPVVTYVMNQLQITNLEVGGSVSELMTGMTIPLHIAVSQQESVLADILTRAMEQITVEELAELKTRWLSHERTDSESAEFQTSNLTPEERVWLRENVVFQMAVSEDWPPFEFIDQDGRHVGISSEYTRWLEETLSIRLNPETGRTWDEMLEAMRNGEVDVISSIVASEEREEYLHFTRPFLEVPMVIATQDDAEYVENLERLEGKTVAVVRGYVIQNYLEQDYPEIKLLPLDNAEDCLRAVAEGRAFAVVETGLVLHYLTNKLGLRNVTVVAPTPYTYDLCFGVRKDLPELAAILDAALATVPATDRAVFSERWSNVRFERDVDWTRVWLWGLAFSLVGVVILSVVFYSNHKLSREATVRKAAEMKLRAMSDASHDAVIMINGQGIVLFWNVTAERMFGIPEEQALNTRMHHIFVPEAFREAADRGLEEFARTGRGPVAGAMMEYEALRRDGSRFPVEVAVSSFQLENEWYTVCTVRDITSRKQAEKKIFESQQKMRTLIDNIPAVVLMKDLQGKYMMANAVFSQVTGVDYRKVVGRTDYDIFSAEVAQEIVVMDRKTLEGGEKIKFEEDVSHQDGGRRTYETVNAPLIDDDGRVYGMVGVSTDITDRKAVERKILEAKEQIELASQRFSTLFEMSPIGIALADHATGNFIEVNRSLLESTGYTKEEFITLSYWDLTPSEYEAQEMRQIEDLNTTGRFGPNEKEYIRKDGTRFPLRIQGFILTDLDGRKVVWGILEDVSELKKKEKEIEKWTRELQESNRQLSENLAQLERFSRLVVGREERMIELKAEINELLVHQGLEAKYKIIE